jgi:RHS repeat-associated protein
MIYRRNAIPFTSLLAMALAAAALCASSAPAAVWTIGGKTLAELGLKEETVISTAAPFSIEVPALKLKIECEEKGSGKVISPGTDEATMELSKCKVVEIKSCTVVEPVVFKGKTELVKKAGIVYDILGAKEVELGTLKFVKGTGCPLPLELKFKGTTAGQLGLEEAVKSPLKFSKAIAESAGTSMLAGANAAFFNGTSNRELSGAKKATKWGICALCGVFSYSAEEAYGMSNPAEPNVIRSFEGNSINLATGNLVQTQADLSTAGRGPALEMTRTYNSRLAATAKAPGAFGYGWTGTYSANLVVNEAADTVTVRNDNGSTVVFYLLEGKYEAASWVQAKLAKEGTDYIYTLPNQLKLTFNSSGQLTKETDRHKNTITLAYNGKKQLETATDASGRKLTFTFSEGGQIESIKDPMGHLAKYTYESSNLAAVKLPEEKLRWKFGYDASHQMTGLTNGREKTTTFKYDGSQRVELEEDALARKRALAYPSGTETKVTEPNTAVTVAVFNSVGEPTSVISASGTAIAATTKSEYDSSFNPKATTDPNSHTTKYGYDAEGNKTSEKDANENETKWTYNSTHDALTTTTPKNETTTITRNASGDPETIKRPAPGATIQETKFKWAENGDLEEETDSLSHKTTFKYDKYGDEESETDPEEDKRTRSYDENGRVISEVSPRGYEAGKTPSEYETKIKRDAQGRPEVMTDPLGHETKHKYDDNGNLEALTNPNNHTTTYVYDAVDQRTEAKAANGEVSKTAYDSEGNVESTTDGNNHTTKYDHNLLNQLTKTTDPLKRETTRAYDAAGNLKELKDAKGRTITYAYDAGDRLEKVDYSDASTADVNYKYGKDDEVTEMKDGTGAANKTYDELDRLTVVENGAKEVIKYKYDLGNEITEITYPNKSSITRSFDKEGRLEAVKDWLGKETKFSYNRDSMPAATTFPAASENKDEYAYDRAGRLEEATMKKGAETLASLTYARDSAGQLESSTQTGLPGAEETEYGYDEKERMTSGAGAVFKYDAANSPTEVAGATQKFDEASQLTEVGSTKYIFNEVGERTEVKPKEGPVTKYGYDQAGNLISITKEGSIEDTYAYDGNGLRASQTIKGAKTQMAWDTAEELPLLLYDGTNCYLYGPDGAPFEQIAEETATYLHHDQQGSTRLLTNSEGKATGKYTYTPYGEVEEHAGSTSTPLGYGGQYRNESTGLIYLRKRVYDPKTAQFVSVDPRVAETGEAYGYAGADPVNAGDPSGEQVRTPLPQVRTQRPQAGFSAGVGGPAATGGGINMIIPGSGYNPYLGMSYSTFGFIQSGNTSMLIPAWYYSPYYGWYYSGGVIQSGNMNMITPSWYYSPYYGWYSSGGVIQSGNLNMITPSWYYSPYYGWYIGPSVIQSGNGR